MIIPAGSVIMAGITGGIVTAIVMGTMMAITTAMAGIVGAGMPVVGTAAESEGTKWRQWQSHCRRSGRCPAGRVRSPGFAVAD